MQTHIKLNNGNLIPTVGLGTWESPQNEAGNAVKYALLKAGYTHIDCAKAYGNEVEIGNAFTEAFKKVKREEVFITSKLWNTDHHPDNVEKACRQTLSDLKLEYLDLYLMHWGIAFKHGNNVAPFGPDGKILTEAVPVSQTWKAMEQLVKKGLVKSIGVANFSTIMLVDLFTYATITPVMNQIELHPYNTQQELVDYCHYHKVAVTGYSPMGRQGVTTDGPKLVNDPVVQNIATTHGKSVSQILLHWAVMRGTVTIPKSVTPSRILENISIFDFEISEEEKIALDNLNKNYRYVNPNHAWGIPVFS